ncbi:MAG: hypothetical protein II794_00020 [Oscillospiraceae bacterium]|nr:hypothetical protein [Oscillospiraceae bacterium]
MKKFIWLILALTILTLSGCSGLLEGEYNNSRPHNSAPALPDTPAVNVSNLSELQHALENLIAAHAEFGRLRFTDYDGDIVSDLAQARLNAVTAYPLGSYAVFYLDYSVNQIVTYYEADITVTYKKTAAEMRTIRSGEVDLSLFLQWAVENRRINAAFFCGQEDCSQAAVDRAMDTLYFSQPEMLYRPEVSVSFYPAQEPGAIAELTLTYPYAAAETQTRLTEIRAAAQEIIEAVDTEDEETPVSTRVTLLAQALRGQVEYDWEREAEDQYSPWTQIYTVYGALSQKRAAGEGFAMAFKFICDRMGIECGVVRGRLNNVSHSWNTVRLENGSLYHLDVTDEQLAFCNDEEMSARYRWSLSDYPACDGPSLIS